MSHERTAQGGAHSGLAVHSTVVRVPGADAGAGAPASAGQYLVRYWKTLRFGFRVGAAAHPTWMTSKVAGDVAVSGGAGFG